jgi:hypothetical protein
MRALVLAMVVALCAWTPAATAQSGASEIDLGDGMRVHRVPRYCFGGSVASGCFAWEPEGFSFGEQVALPFARTFARVPTNGRILAALPLASTLYVPLGYTARMMRSDDRGAHWLEVPWRWAESVSILVFDAGTDDGVAAGDSGYLWATSDGGLTWSEHGSATGTTYVELAMRDSVVVALDAVGNVWRAQHGNFDRQLLLTDRTAHLSTDDDAVVISTDDAVLRVTRHHGVERTRR